MYSFDFYNPTKIIFGKDTISRIGKEIKGRGIKKILLTAGGGSIKKNRVYETTITSLKDSGIDWIEAWGIKPNPVLSKIKETIKSIKTEYISFHW